VVRNKKVVALAASLRLSWQNALNYGSFLLYSLHQIRSSVVDKAPKIDIIWRLKNSSFTQEEVSLVNPSFPFLLTRAVA